MLLFFFLLFSLIKILPGQNRVLTHWIETRRSCFQHQNLTLTQIRPKRNSVEMHPT